MVDTAIAAAVVVGDVVVVVATGAGARGRHEIENDRRETDDVGL